MTVPTATATATLPPPLKTHKFLLIVVRRYEYYIEAENREQARELYDNAHKSFDTDDPHTMYVDKILKVVKV